MPPSRYYIRILLIFIMLVSGSVLHGQAQPATTRHYTTADGLPSNTVYCSLQDRDGFLWFGTDKGVARFDGEVFDVWEVEDGLPDNSILSLLEDSEGRIWFASFDGTPGYFYKGNLFTPANTEWLAGLRAKDFVTSIYEDEQGRILLSGKIGSAIRITPEVGGEVLAYQDRTLGFAEYDEELYLINNQLGVLKWDESKQPAKVDTVQLRFREIRVINATKALYHPTQHSVFYFEIFHGMRVVRKHIFDSVTFIQDAALLDLETINFGPLTESGVWVTHDGGYSLLEWTNGNLEVIQTIDFPEELVSHLVIAADGSHWISTLNNGVYYQHEGEIGWENPENPPIPIFDLELYHGDLVYAGGYSTFGKYSYPSFQHNTEFRTDINYPAMLEKVPFWPELLVNKSFEAIGISPDLSGIAFLTIGFHAYSQNGMTFSHHTNQFFVRDSLVHFTNPGYVEWFSNSLQKVNMRAVGMEVLSDSILWVATRDSLFEYSMFDRTFTWQPEFGSDFNGLTTETYNSRPYVWLFGTGEFWAIDYPRRDTLYYNLESLGQDVVFECVSVIGDSIFALGSDKGVVVLRDKGRDGNLTYLRTINQSVGLGSNVVHDLLFLRDTLFVATDVGIAHIKLDQLVSQPNLGTPKVFIKGVWVDGVFRGQPTKLELEPDQNNIRIQQAGIHYPSLGEIAFRYRINEGEWTTLEGQELQLVGMPPGQYIYEVQAQSAFGNWSDTTGSLTFFISKPYWKQGWFITLLVLALMAMVGGGLLVRFNQLKFRNEISRESAELELKALKAQMSPHFIFNVLSSIQRYILANDAKPANEYLTKFSRLTRLILNNSERTMVSLREEIQTLVLYIDLEHLRLNHQFEYEILVDDQLNQDVVEIPPLLLQTFVENAIWHGLSPMQTEGRLEVIFEKLGDNLQIRIWDNGIGRKAAGIRNPRQGESKGSRLTAQKLEVLNKTVYRKQASIRIRDLYGDEGEPSGTEVIMLLPLT